MSARQGRLLGGAYPMRSWMFVPGSSLRFLEKARSCGADVAILDLEDGVAPSEKVSARSNVLQSLRETWTGPLRIVRVNGLGTDWCEADIESVVGPRLGGICLPKVDSEEDIDGAAKLLAKWEARRHVGVGSTLLVAAIESAEGMWNARAIASVSPRVVALLFGAEDYALDLGLDLNREGEALELIYHRSALVTAAAAARVMVVDGVYPRLDDEDGLRRDALMARRLGFSGKSTFNPRQLDVLNEVFSPSESEVRYARRVVEAFEDAEARGDGAIAVGGQLVDQPVVLRARRVLAVAKALGRA